MAPPRKTSPRRGGRRQPAIPWSLLASGLAAVALLAFWWYGPRPADPAAPKPAGSAAVVPDPVRTYAEYAGSASCRECHEAAYTAWETSHHALAERPMDPARDGEAFDPPRQLAHGSQHTTVGAAAGGFQVRTRGLSGHPETCTVARVIGHDPLRQFLVPYPGGRWQALEAAWDPHRREWFNVFGAEDRQPGEWGHWTGRGMNWNAMCAGCHNVRVRKNYDPATDTYRTAWVEHGVGCEACHGPLRRHVDWRRRFPDRAVPDPTLPAFTAHQMFATCAACHARRGDLTGDFAPGEDFFDHFSPSLVDESDLFYPDGQVRDEDFEYAAFLGSRMGAAGVSCLDCHEPHSAKTRLPGNWLCLRCHNGSYPNAPVIEPVAHSRHRVFGYDTHGVPQPVDLAAYDPRQIAETGGECVACHMPVTTYMQRHPRHDHGFTIPDPRLTRELGIPNACNRCHTDQSVDWALEHTERWYGEKMERPSRQRTRVIAAARAGDPGARGPLLALLNTETNVYWQAVAAGLLGQWVDDSAVAAALRARLAHPHPLVRERAARALEPRAPVERDTAAALAARLEDPVRAVRLAAAWALRDRLELDSRAGRELRHLLDLHADQPTGQMQRGALALERGELGAALAAYARAVAWDPNSAPIRHDYAVALSRAGRAREALEQLQAACRLAPREAEYAFKLGLAWNELGQLSEAAAALERAVQLDPRHARAGYNLGLAHSALGRPAEAESVLAAAEAADPADPRIPYARATVLVRLGRFEEARAAAARALALGHEPEPVRALLRALER